MVGADGTTHLFVGRGHVITRREEHRVDVVEMDLLELTEMHVIRLTGIKLPSCLITIMYIFSLILPVLSSIINSHKRL